MSNVAIIGYGNVGYHFARALSKRHRVSIYSRNHGEDHINSISTFKAVGYDFILLTVPDDRVKEISNSLEVSEAIVLHTSGSRPISDLEAHNRCGVIYPLQTFTKNTDVDFKSVQLFVEGKENTLRIVDEFARQISDQVKILNSIDRAKLHLAAVFACNFSNHMFHIAEETLEEIGLNFSDIRSLVDETVRKAMEFKPSKTQTGPAVRNDVATLAKHGVLIADEDTRELYRIITKSIQKKQ